MKESFAGRGALKHSAAVDSAPRRKGVDRRRHRFIQCLLRMASLLLAVAAVGAAAIPVAAARTGSVSLSTRPLSSSAARPSVC